MKMINDVSILISGSALQWLSTEKRPTVEYYDTVQTLVSRAGEERG
jgi:hypothetical protein